MSRPLDRIRLLVEALRERGRLREARAIMRDIAWLRYKVFPDRPDVGFDRFVSAYEDAAQGIKQEETERARVRVQTTGDPTAKSALRELGLDRVDEQLEEIWDKHAELLDLPGRGRARTRVWRDDEAQAALESSSDEYSATTNAETRDRYPGAA
jgi:hypothetical protein